MIDFFRPIDVLLNKYVLLFLIKLVLIKEKIYELG